MPPETDLNAERLRRLAAVMKVEREITGQARWAYMQLLAMIRRDVLDGASPRAITAAIPDTTRNRNQINAAWLALLAPVRRTIAALFRTRFLSTGARRKSIQAAQAAYLASIDGHLEGVPNEVYKDLERIASEGIRQGWSEQRIRQAMRAELTPGHPEYTARLDSVSARIGRTEAIAAFNAGEQAGWVEESAESGIRLTKRWLSSHDTKVRETHAIADGQVVAADQHFFVGGERAMYPGDPALSPAESVNCRCTALYSRVPTTNTANIPLVAGADMPKLLTTDRTLPPLKFATSTTTERAPAEAPTQMLALPNGWSGVIAGLDIETGDGRYLATPEGGVRTREYPLSLTLGHVGDGDAPVIGSVDRVWVGDGVLYAEGKIDLGGAAGGEFARQLTEGYINTVSIDPDQVVGELQMRDPEGNSITAEEAQAIYDENEGMLPDGYREILVFTDWRLAGLAVVPIPAYTEARIEGVRDYVASGPQSGDAVIATIGGQIFTKAFFEAEATGPTKLTVTDDGHVFGHVREYGTCYQYGGGQGNGGYCMEPPLSACGYAKFHAHSARLDDGSIIDVGALTFGEGHESRGGLMASRRHYDDVATMAAKVVASEDEWGVWITGEVLDAHRENALDLLLSPLSGHWEPDADNDGHLEMLAAHVVVTPGYNVRRVVASFGDDRQATSIVVTSVPSARPEPIAASGGIIVSGSGLDVDPVTISLTRKPLGLRDLARAQAAMKTIGIDPASRLERALARLGR